MNTQALPSLSLFADWIRTTDDHAAHRLALADEARRLLADLEAAPWDARIALADRLERWRYQLLNERRGQWTSDDQRLADALDLTTLRLAGRPSRPARAARAAIEKPPAEVDWSAALAGLESTFDLADLIARAADATAAEFGPLDVEHAGEHGRLMRLHAPVYLSNCCVNHCVYCGFGHARDVERRHLTVDEAVAEAQIVLARGLRDQLLLAGDFPALDRTSYFVAILDRLATLGIRPSLEIAPQSTSSYAAMADAGACGVTVYQETYDERLYARYHPRGPKHLYDWRLEGLERAADAGMGRLGLGVLLGLADPRRDLVALMRHADYLRRRFPDRELAFSLPRLHDTPHSFTPPHPVDDDTFVRLFCVLRLAFPRADLVLSTRESPSMRNRLAVICITRLSAGSSTAPGGYGRHPAAEQFPVHDRRTVAEVTAWLRASGFRTEA